MASPEQVERKEKRESEDGDNTVSIIIMQDTRRTFKTDRTVPTVGEDDGPMGAKEQGRSRRELNRTRSKWQPDVPFLSPRLHPDFTFLSVCPSLTFLLLFLSPPFFLFGLVLPRYPVFFDFTSSSPYRSHLLFSLRTPSIN